MIAADDARDKLEAAKKQLEAAETALDNWENEHRLPIKAQVLDKKRQTVEVLIIDTDPPGFMGMILKKGNPFAFDESGLPKENEEKLESWINICSNLDLRDPEVQKAVGVKSLLKAREIVSNFFMLYLVSNAGDILSAVNGSLSSLGADQTTSEDSQET